MRVHLYALCWNDARMLGFFFRHYDPFVTRYTIFDDCSDDGSLEILRAHPRVEVRPVPEHLRPIGAGTAAKLWNNCWKESRGDADWVIVGEIDEHLDHPDIVGYLGACSAEGVTAIPALGFQMISRQFPNPDERLCTTLTFGYPRSGMSKLSIFNPDAIEEINYDVGRHRAAPTGRVFTTRRDEVLNRHHKYIDVDYVRGRHRALGARLSREEIEKGLGVHWFHDDEALLRGWVKGEKDAVNLADPSLNLDEVHRDTVRWWSEFRIGASTRNGGTAASTDID
jgi:glycosyltransferase involved in cell wall biosynthesis